MFSRKEWAHYSWSVTWYKILMQLYQNKCVNDLLPDLPNLNPSKKKKTGNVVSLFQARLFSYRPVQCIAAWQRVYIFSY